MVFAKYVASVLTAYLGAFIKDINKESINISLLSGSIELKNLELAPTFLASNGLVSLKRGFIDSLVIKVPWTSLYSKQCEIRIKEILVIFQPATDVGSSNFSPSSSASVGPEDSVQSKRDLLDIAEATQNVPSATKLATNDSSPSKGSEPAKSVSKDGFFQRLRNTILNNVVVTVENVIIKYENFSGAFKGLGIVSVLEVKKSVCEAANSKFEAMFIQGDSPSMYRSITYESASLGLYTISESKTAAMDESNSLPLEALKKMLKQNAMDELRNYCLLHPSSGKFCFTILPQAIFLTATTPSQRKDPLLQCAASIKNGAIQINPDTVLSCQAFSHYLKYSQKLSKWWNVRPLHRPLHRGKKGSCASEWWYYAIQRVLCELQEEKKRKRFDWEKYKEWKRFCDVYYHAYLRMLGAPWVVSKANTEIVEAEAEERLSVHDMWECRKQAKYVMKRYHQCGLIVPRSFGEEGKSAIVSITNDEVTGRDSTISYAENETAAVAILLENEALTEINEEENADAASTPNSSPVSLFSFRAEWPQLDCILGDGVKLAITNTCLSGDFSDSTALLSLSLSTAKLILVKEENFAFFTVHATTTTTTNNNSNNSNPSVLVYYNLDRVRNRSITSISVKNVDFFYEEAIQNAILAAIKPFASVAFAPENVSTNSPSTPTSEPSEYLASTTSSASSQGLSKSVPSRQLARNTLTCQIQKVGISCLDVFVSLEEINYQSKISPLQVDCEQIKIKVGSAIMAECSECSLLPVDRSGRVYITATAVLGSDIGLFQRAKSLLDSVALLVSNGYTELCSQSPPSGSVATVEQKKDENSNADPLSLLIVLPSLTLDQLEVFNFRLNLLSCADGMKISIICNGFRHDSRLCDDGSLKVSLWTYSQLAFSTFEQLEPSVTMGIHIESNKVEFHANEELVSTIEKLYDMIMFVFSAPLGTPIEYFHKPDSLPISVWHVDVHNSLLFLYPSEDGEVVAIRFNGEKSLSLGMTNYDDSRISLSAQLGSLITISSAQHCLDLFPRSRRERFHLNLTARPPTIEESSISPHQQLHLLLQIEQWPIAIHLGLLMDLYRQFSQPTDPLYRVRNIASRVHLAERSLYSSTYYPAYRPLNFTMKIEMVAHELLYPITLLGKSNVYLSIPLTQSEYNLSFCDNLFVVAANANVLVPRTVISSCKNGIEILRRGKMDRMHELQTVEADSSVMNNCALIVVSYIMDYRNAVVNGPPIEKLTVSMESPQSTLDPTLDTSVPSDWPFSIVKPILFPVDFGTLVSWLSLFQLPAQATREELEKKNSTKKPPAPQNDAPPRNFSFDCDIAPLFIHLLDAGVQIALWDGVNINLDRGPARYRIKSTTVFCHKSLLGMHNTAGGNPFYRLDSYNMQIIIQSFYHLYTRREGVLVEILSNNVDSFFGARSSDSQCASAVSSLKECSNPTSSLMFCENEFRPEDGGLQILTTSSGTFILVTNINFNLTGSIVESFIGSLDFLKGAWRTASPWLEARLIIQNRLLHSVGGPSTREKKASLWLQISSIDCLFKWQSRIRSSVVSLYAQLSDVFFSNAPEFKVSSGNFGLLLGSEGSDNLNMSTAPTCNNKARDSEWVKKIPFVSALCVSNIEDSVGDATQTGSQMIIHPFVIMIGFDDYLLLSEILYLIRIARKNREAEGVTRNASLYNIDVDHTLEELTPEMYDTLKSPLFGEEDSKAEFNSIIENRSATMAYDEVISSHSLAAPEHHQDTHVLSFSLVLPEIMLILAPGHSREIFGPTSAPFSSVDASNRVKYSARIHSCRLQVLESLTGGEKRDVFMLSIRNCQYAIYSDASSLSLGEVLLEHNKNLPLLRINDLKYHTPNQKSIPLSERKNAPEDCNLVSLSCESFTTDLNISSVLACSNYFLKRPAQVLGPLYTMNIIYSGQSSGKVGNGARDQEMPLHFSKNGIPAPGASTVSRKATLYRVTDPVWTLEEDFLLNQEELVLHFCNTLTNHIQVNMNNHRIEIDPSILNKVGLSRIVLIIDEDLTVSFSDGAFVFPTELWDFCTSHRVKNSGLESILLPFTAIGEGSYICCNSARFLVSDDSITESVISQKFRKDDSSSIASESPSTPLLEPHHSWCSQKEIETDSTYALLSVASVKLSIESSKDARLLRVTFNLESRFQFCNDAVDAVDASIKEFAIGSQSTETESTATMTTILAPTTINLCTSQSHRFAISLGALLFDLTRSDAILLNTFISDIQKLMEQADFLVRSESEREILELIEQTLAWKSFSGNKGNDFEEEIPVKNGVSKLNSEAGDEADEDKLLSNLSGEKGKEQEELLDVESPTSNTFSMAAFCPVIDVTVSDNRYPLFRLILPDFVFKYFSFYPGRTFFIQNRGTQLEVYGKGRWDSLFPESSVLTARLRQTYSKNSTTEQFSIECDNLFIQLSYFLASKLKHVLTQLETFVSIFASSLDADTPHGELQEEGVEQDLSPSDPVKPSSLSRCLISSRYVTDDGPTHRFVNVFDTDFFIVLGSSLEGGIIMPLSASSFAEITIPYRKASKSFLFLLTPPFVNQKEDGSFYVNELGLAEKNTDSSIPVSSLQYGTALDVEVDGLNVVFSCIQNAAAQTMVEYAFSDWSEAESTAPTSATVGQGKPVLQTPSEGNNCCTVAKLLSVNSALTADESGLLTVRICPKFSLRNETGLILELQEHLATDNPRMLKQGQHSFEPGTQHLLHGTCHRVFLHVTIAGLHYRTLLNVLSIEGGTLLELAPVVNPRSQSQPVEKRHDEKLLPVSFFVSVNRMARNYSTVIVLLPRLTIINHLGVPVKVSFWQSSAASDLSSQGDPSLVANWLNSKWKKSKKEEEMHSKLQYIGGHAMLPHSQALAISRCNYEGNLVVGMTFSQCTGEQIGCSSPIEVTRKLQDHVGKDPLLLRLRDSNGRLFYVQVSVLHRTIILSVGLWVYNLTEYPLLMTDDLITRRLSSGQSPNNGITPSLGVPFLIGCRLTEFMFAYLKIGLDSRWSNAIPIDLGSSGVAECVQKKLGFTRSCNYVIQFPSTQEGKPVVLLVAPRWIFVNNTRRRLKFHFNLNSMKKVLKRGTEKHDEKGLDTEEMSAVASLTSLTLKPGEYHVSCVGGKSGNKVSFQDTLEDAIPSVTTISDTSVKHCNLSQRYDAQKTRYVSIDHPGHSTFNLWATPKLENLTAAIEFSAPVMAVGLSNGSTARYVSPYDDAILTGRISTSIEQVGNTLAVLVRDLKATSIWIQNRLVNRTVMVRQEGSGHRNIALPGKNKFFLWEDHQGNHTLRVHVVGFKGVWYSIDFSKGDGHVELRYSCDENPFLESSTGTTSLKAAKRAPTSIDSARSPFYVRAYNSPSRSRICIIISDVAVPFHTSMGYWRSYFVRSIHIPFAKLTWLTEPLDAQHLEAFTSLSMKDLHAELFNTDSNRVFSLVIRRLQLMSEKDQHIVLHRAQFLSALTGRNIAKKTDETRACFSLSKKRSQLQTCFFGWLSQALDTAYHADDFVLTSNITKFADGLTRVSELSCTVVPLVIDISDSWLAGVLQESRRLPLLLTATPGNQKRVVKGTGNEQGGQKRAIVSSDELSASNEKILVPQSVFVFTLFKQLQCSSETQKDSAYPSHVNSDINKKGTEAAKVNASQASRSASSSSKVSNTDTSLPTLLVVEKLSISQLALFVTFSRHTPDPLWPFLGVYTLMLPSRLKQREFHWKPFLLEREVETMRTLTSLLTRWISHGAMRQWTKVTKLGRLLEIIEGRRHALIENAPQALVPGNDPVDEDEN